VYEKYDGGMIYLGDNSHFSIVCRGRFMIRFPNILKGITRVFYILDMTKNLMLVRRLNDVGVEVVFNEK
jgi:hypothetical protein